MHSFLPPSSLQPFFRVTRTFFYGLISVLRAVMRTRIFLMELLPVDQYSIFLPEKVKSASFRAAGEYSLKYFKKEEIFCAYFKLFIDLYIGRLIKSNASYTHICTYNLKGVTANIFI